MNKEQWLEVGAMEMEMEEYQSIQISALEVDLVLPEARERIKEKAMLDVKYRELGKPVTKGGNINKNFSIMNELLCWKNKMYVPQGLRQMVIQSEHECKVAGYFKRERTLKVLTRKFYQTIWNAM